MNKKEAKAEIKELLRDVEHHNACKSSAEKRIVELQSIIDAPDSGWFVPEIGEEYHFCDESGIYSYSSHDDTEDKDILARQKVFRTEAEAQKADDKRKATVKYLREIARLNGNWKFDWENVGQNKYVAYLYNEEIKIGQYLTVKHKDSDWYSISEQAATQAVSILSQEEQDLIFRS